MRAVLCVFSSLVVAGTAAAEPGFGLEPIDALDLPFDHAELRLTARGTGPGSFDDAGSYRDGSVTLAAALPVYERAGWRLLAQVRIAGERVVTTALPRDESITEDAVGATALYTSARHDLYAVYAGAAIAESSGTLSRPTPMPTAIGLGSYRSGALTWLYGGGFGYALGRPWLLPVAGVSWRASPSWTLSTLLPVEAAVRVRLTPALAMALVVSVSGDRYHIANDGAYPGEGDTLTVRLGQLRTKLDTRYKLGRRWTLTAELGVIGPRRLQIADGDTLDMSSTSRGAAYISTGVSYAFDDL